MTPILGLPDFFGWAQCVEVSSDEVSGACVLGVRGEDAAVVGRALVDKLSHVFPQTSEDFHTLVEQLQAIAAQHEAQLSLAAALQVDSQVLFASLGGAVLLKRGDKVGAVLKGDDSIQVVVGSAQEEDVYVLFTAQAKELLNNCIVQFKHGLSVESVSSSLSTTVATAKEPASAGVVLIAPEHEQDEVQEAEQQDNTAVYPGGYSPGALYSNDDSENDLRSDDSLESPVGVPQEAVVPSRTEQKKSDPSTVSVFGKKILRTAVTGFHFFKKLVGILVKQSVAIGAQVKELIRRRQAGEVYIDAKPKVSKKILFAVVLGMLALVATVLGFTTWKNRAIANAKDALSPYQEQLQQAQQTLDSDPVTAREKVAGIISELEALNSTYSERAFGKHLVEQQLADAQALYEEISGKEEFNSLPVFYDLRLAQPDFVTTLADAELGTAAFYDEGTNSVIILELRSKEARSVSLDTESSVEAINVHVDLERIELLAGGITALDLAETEDPTLTELKAEGDSNREATLLNSFGEYLYVFNPEKRNIYRYAPTEDGYSDPIGWLVSPLGVSFADVTSWAVDGSIWIATKTGEVLKFTSGSADDFEIRGLSDPFSSSIYVYTTSDYENVYVLEPEKRRVVILRKDGTFLREYKSASLASVTNFFVDEEQGYIYPVSGSIVFSISLQ